MLQEEYRTHNKVSYAGKDPFIVISFGLLRNIIPSIEMKRLKAKTIP
jgi:hypothetical protein